jgi:hypothetical protein
LQTLRSVRPRYPLEIRRPGGDVMIHDAPANERRPLHHPDRAGHSHDVGRELECRCFRRAREHSDNTGVSWHDRYYYVAVCPDHGDVETWDIRDDVPRLPYQCIRCTRWITIELRERPTA